jgi:hypothetical protein
VEDGECTGQLLGGTILLMMDTDGEGRMCGGLTTFRGDGGALVAHGGAGRLPQH